MAQDSNFEQSRSSASAARRCWSEFEDQVNTGKATPNFRLGIAATFTAESLAPFIGVHLLMQSIRPRIDIAPYNQLVQTCLDPRRHFGSDCDTIVLLWRMEDFLSTELSDFFAGNREALENAIAKTDWLIDAVAQLRQIFSGTIIVGLPPFPSQGAVALGGLEVASSPITFHRTYLVSILERFGKIGGVHILDLDAVQREMGVPRSLDWRQLYLYRQPFTDEFLNAAAGRIARIVSAGRKAAKKCIVVDADNTLWGGVIGEDGLDGIEIGDEFPGSAYRDLQSQLVHFSSRGILIAMASKNNETDVWDVFDKHGGMLLKRDHISAWEINWRPKPDNIRAIAKKLNIGTDSLVFLDDSPMEIAQMQSALPEVTCVQVPEDPAEILPLLQSLTHFDTLEVTEEDRTRGQMMRAERDREALGASLSMGEFQSALKLSVQFAIARPEELGRVTQLINKTNQFNLTTIRRTIDEVRALAASSSHHIYAIRVTDKFGDYGLTGVIIAEETFDRSNWHMDTMLLSCRVLGRGVEAELVSMLAQDALASGATTLTAKFIPTAKNAPASTFLPDNGFAAEGKIWRRQLSDVGLVDAAVLRAGAPV